MGSWASRAAASRRSAPTHPAAAAAQRRDRRRDASAIGGATSPDVRRARCGALRGAEIVDDLPGSADEPEPDVHGRDAASTMRCRRTGAEGGGSDESAAPPRDRGCARGGRHPRPRRAPRRLPAPVLGRHAAADHDRDGAPARAGDAHRGRADVRPRRHPGGADPRACSQAAAARARHGHPLHLARPRRGRADLRPGRRHVRRPRRRGGRRAGRLRAPAPPVHAGAARVDPVAATAAASASPRSPAASRASRHSRRAASSPIGARTRSPSTASASPS